MAILTEAQLKSNLASMFETGGVNLASEYRSYMTDVIDTLGQMLFPHPFSAAFPTLSAGDWPVRHILNRPVYGVYVLNNLTGQITFPNFTIIDNSLYTLHWAGGSWTDFQIYTVAKFGSA